MLKPIYFRLITSVLLCLGGLSATHAQLEYGYSRTIRIYAPTFKPYTDIDGSPFIPGDSVQNGWLMNGTKKIPARLRYNSFTNEIEYVEGHRILTPTNSVAEFAILEPDTLYFRRGFPAVDTKTAGQFYQLLFNGRKAKLLRQISTSIKSNTESMSNDFGKRRFQKHEEHYVWIANTRPPAENYFEKLAEGDMKPVILNKKTLITLFPANTERINQYVADKKIKLKSWDEFASVLRYLETQ